MRIPSARGLGKTIDGRELLVFALVLSIVFTSHVRESLELRQNSL